jgi:hypothetical protein
VRIPAASIILCAAALVACDGGRFDPCGLLTVDEARALDDSITTSLWAGQHQDKADNEVCMFYNDNGDARMMLFAWYDDAEPRELVADGSSANAIIETFAPAALDAAASFGPDGLQLLAARSGDRVVGFQVRKPVHDGSPSLERVFELAEAALDRAGY